MTTAPFAAHGRRRPESTAHPRTSRPTTAFQLLFSMLTRHLLWQRPIWIGGYSVFQTDMTYHDSLLTTEGIAHSTETPTSMAPRWDSGWVRLTLSALEQESLNVH